MYPVNAQILGEEEVFGGWKREGDVLFKWRGKDRCVKIFCQGDGRVAGFWKRYGGRYETVEVRGLPRYLKGEVQEVSRMLEGGYVRFLRDCVEVRARGVGGMMEGEGEEEVDFEQLLEEVEDEKARANARDAVKKLLRNDPEEKWLSFIKKKIGFQGIRAVAPALVRNQTVETLDLDFNEIGDAGAEVLAKVLKKNQVLKSLELGWNAIGVKGAEALSKVLENNETLQILELNNNEIGDEGVKELGAALEKNQKLQTLELGNNQIRDAGAEVLGVALEKNQKLQKLRLNVNQIGSAGAKALGKALEKNQMLRELDLHHNQIDDDGAKALGAALKENQTLQRLKLSHNKIGDAGAVALGAALKKLQNLDLSSNQIGDEGAKALGAALKENQTLQNLDLNGNRISDAGVAQVLMQVQICLNRNNKIATSSTKPIFSKYKYPTKPFFDRPSLIKQVENILLDENHTNKQKTKVVVLSGESGVGKTELANKFIEKNFAKYSLIWTFDCQSKETLNNDYRNLAYQLGLVNNAEGQCISMVDICDKVNDLLEKLTCEKEWLLLFTNVNDGILDVVKWQPKCGGCVLITSKSKSWQTKDDVAIIEVPKFTREESIKLLENILQSDIIKWISSSKAEENSLDALAAELEDIPLALVQAGNFIKKRNEGKEAYYIDTYLEMWKSPPTEPLKIVTMAWQMTMNHMRKEYYTAYEVLHLLAYFNAEKIPFDWVKSGLKDVANLSDETIKVIEYLNGYLMVRYDEERKILNIHPLLQQMIRNDLQGVLQRKFMEQALDIVLEKFTSYESLPHAIKIVKFVNDEHEKQQYLEKTAKLLSKMAKYTKSQGDFLLTKKYYEQLLDIYRIIYYEKSFRVADVLEKLGELSLNLKEDKEANKFFEQCLDIYKFHYGENSVEIVMVLLEKALLGYGPFYQKLKEEADKKENQNPDVLYAMGILLEEGVSSLEIRSQPQEAIKYYKMAATQGSLEARNYLKHKGAFMFKKSGQYEEVLDEELGEYYEEVIAQEMRQSEEESFEQVMKLEMLLAQWRVVLQNVERKKKGFESEEDSSIDEISADSISEKSLSDNEEGELGVEHLLGTALLGDQSSYEMLKAKADEEGDLDALYAMGFFLETKKEPLEQAIEYYTKAAAQNSLEAKQRLEKEGFFMMKESGKYEKVVDSELDEYFKKQKEYLKTPEEREREVYETVLRSMKWDNVLKLVDDMQGNQQNKNQ